MNNVILSVNAASEAAIKFAKDGKLPVGEFPAIFTFGYGDKAKTDHVRITGFNGVTESMRTIETGKSYLIEGTLTTETVERPEGFKETRYKIIASKIQPCEESLKLNNVCLVGRLGQAPEVKYFESGSNNAKGTLAVNESRDKTNWFNFELWGKTAETTANYVKKGSQIGLSGAELQIEHYKDKQENERFKFKIVGGKLSLLGNKQQEQSDDEDF